MAVDEAILEAVVARRALPTLRFYAWNPPCLSLGYGQKSAELDLARLKANGWETVRRPTGGRAIFHTDELTYSLSLPTDDDLTAGTVIDSYRRLSQGLLIGLRRLGLSPQAERQTRRIPHSGPVCFETTSPYEITINGRKLIGSAQLRRHGGVLQHGSLPLFGDLGRICDALIYADEASREQAKAQVRARAITLTEAITLQSAPPLYPVERGLGGEDVWQTAADTFAAGFAEAFEVDFAALSS